jgi:DNA-directed RNA polymerases I and III subunit RPAC2
MKTDHHFLYSPDVEFCGYSVPHPSESKIMLRIQCREKPAIEALRSGLDELKRVCDVLMEKFSNGISAGDHEIDMEKEI